MTPRLRTLPFLLPQGFFDLAYAEWGPRDGPPILCAHGLTRNSRDFDALAQAFATRGRRVVAVDFPGRGRSAWLPDPAQYVYPTYLAALSALIARLDAPSVDWIGTSMGGLAGMMLAAQTGTPIARLVVNDVGPFIPKAALERIAGYVGETPRFASLQEVEQYLRRVAAPFGALSDAQWRHLAEHGATQDAQGWRLHYDPAIATPFLAAPAADVDLWPLWSRITCPTLVVRGADSDLLLAETAERMTARTDGGVRLVTFAGCGHAPALMDAAQISAVADFLGA
jgi:pimeloyl-ACP methyl ester carboxylesterase